MLREGCYTLYGDKIARAKFREKLHTKKNCFFFSAEIREGKESLIEKIKSYKPLLTCFNGKGNYSPLYTVIKSFTNSRPLNCLRQVSIEQ